MCFIHKNYDYNNNLNDNDEDNNDDRSIDFGKLVLSKLRNGQRISNVTLARISAINLEKRLRKRG